MSRIMTTEIVVYISFAVCLTIVELNTSYGQSKDETGLNTVHFDSETKDSVLNFQKLDKLLESNGPVATSDQWRLLQLNAETTESGSASMCKPAESLIELISRFTTVYLPENQIEECFTKYFDERLVGISNCPNPDNAYYIPLLTIALNQQIPPQNPDYIRDLYSKYLKVVYGRSKDKPVFDSFYYTAILAFHATGALDNSDDGHKKFWDDVFSHESSIALMLTRQMLDKSGISLRLSSDALENLETLKNEPVFPKTCWYLTNVFRGDFDNAVAAVQLEPGPERINWKRIIKDHPFFDHISMIDASTGIGFSWYAYLANQPTSFTELGVMGADIDTKLLVDIYYMVREDFIEVPGPTFCPRVGDTILLAAALDPFRKDDFIPIILKYTKNPDQRDLLNRNALHRILYHRMGEHQANLLKLLIEAGTDVNAESVSGNTPAHVAVYRNSHLLPLLIEAGADLTKKNQRGETPVDLLRRSVKEKWIFHEESVTVLKSLEDPS